MARQRTQTVSFFHQPLHCAIYINITMMLLLQCIPPVCTVYVHTHDTLARQPRRDAFTHLCTCRQTCCPCCQFPRQVAHIPCTYPKGFPESFHHKKGFTSHLSSVRARVCAVAKQRREFLLFPDVICQVLEELKI